MTAVWQTRTRSPEPDALAPDGSQIFVLAEARGASMVACRLPAGQVTRAVRHRSVEELWVCVGGGGQLWRAAGSGSGETVVLAPGVAASIPVGTAFQFRADAEQPLELVIATVPPWPGADEAMPVEGIWPPSVPA